MAQKWLLADPTSWPSCAILKNQYKPTNTFREILAGIVQCVGPVGRPVNAAATQTRLYKVYSHCDVFLYAVVLQKYLRDLIAYLIRSVRTTANSN